MDGRLGKTHKRKRGNCETSMKRFLFFNGNQIRYDVIRDSVMCNHESDYTEICLYCSEWILENSREIKLITEPHVRLFRSDEGVQN
jgi:hypothetical protein